MIITYHHIIPSNKIPKIRNSEEGWEWSISPEQFKLHIETLVKNGFKFISIDEKYSEIINNGHEAYKSIVITFDDGWKDNYDYAFPILKEFNIPATFFITTAHLKENNNEPNKMTINQLKHLIDNNMTISSHTRNHKTLTKLNNKELEHEVNGSKTDIENTLNIKVDHFAYPGGAFNSKVIDTVKTAGYKTACSIISPAIITNSDTYWMYRNHFSDNMKSFADIYRQNKLLTKLIDFRVKKKIKQKLS